MNRKITLLIIGIMILAGAFTSYLYFGIGGKTYQLSAVREGDIIQEISASGKVEPPTKIDLHFKNSGKLTILKVKTGRKISAGQFLAKQDTSVLDAQLAEMQAGIDVQKAKLDQLILGASAEDVKVAQTVVDSAKQDLANGYSSSLNVLDGAYIKSYNAYAAVVSLQNNYFPLSDQQGIKVEEAKNKINSLVPDIKKNIDSISSGFSADGAILNVISDLKSIGDSLEIIRGQCDEGIYYLKVSSADKTIIDTQKANINTALTNITSAQEDIASLKIALQKMEDQLALKKAPPRSPDVDLYEAQIKQAEAQRQRIQAQRQEMIITAPASGIITDTVGEVGEIVTPDIAIVSLMPSGELQIKVDVSEADIVNTKVGQEVKITLDAFGNDTEWKGKVASIDPAETTVSGAVYYKTTVLFDQEDDRVRSGMTANIWIKVASKENILYIPISAIKTTKGKEPTDSKLYSYVHVLEGKQVREKDVQTGIKGDGGVIEIISGLKEGEQIIVPK